MFKASFRRSVAAAFVAAVLALGLMTGVASASVSHTASSAQASGGFMTVTQAAALGIHPNTSTSGYTVSVPKVEHVISDSAQGCNQLVCISVIGSGLHVTSWSTSATFSIQTPAFAIYYVNGTVVATSVIVEAEPGETLGDQAIGSHSYANGTHLCNGWGGTLGYPCETIEG